MSKADVERWRGAADALPGSSVRVRSSPIREVVFEADGVAGFLRKYWKSPEGSSLPGMEVADAHVPLVFADEIESLARGIRTVHSSALFPAIPTSEVPGLEKRARELIGILSNACELVLDDDVQEPADDAFAAAKTRAEDDTRATRIQFLFDLSTIAAGVSDRLAALKDFDTAWIDEARDVARKLSVEGPPRPGKEASLEIDFRNRLLMLLDLRVSKVRRAARYVYRDHPEMIRLVTSAYERKRRLDAKRKKAEEERQKAGGNPDS